MENDARSSELQALVSLIDDPDHKVFLEISERIEGYGSFALPYLQKAWYDCFDEQVRERISALKLKINFTLVSQELSDAFDDNFNDLLGAWISLSRLEYPEIVENEIRFEFNNIRKAIWIELNPNLTALEQIKVFNYVFFDILGFAGNVENLGHPDNFFINTLLKTRLGDPVSLSALYMILAQSLNLPVFGVNIPDHFVLAYTGKSYNQASMLMEDNKVLFYINPFGRGQVFSSPEIEKYLSRIRLEPSPVHFNPCTNSDIFLRLIDNLIRTYDREKNRSFSDFLRSARQRLA